MSSPVRVSLDSTLTSSSNGADMGRMYLPDDDIGNRWTLDRVVWVPTDDELAALPFPLAPDSDQITAGPTVDLSGGPTAYFGQVILDGIPDEINPGGHGLDWIGGTLAGADLRINGGEVTVTLALARRVPNVIATSPTYAISWADVAADFPGVDWDDVDPPISYYDARLAHP